MFLTVIMSVALPVSGFFVPVFIVLTSAMLVSTALNKNFIFLVISSVLSMAALFLLFRSFSLALVLPAILLISSAGIYIALKLKASLKTVILAGTSGGFVLIIVSAALFGTNFIPELVNMAKALFMANLDGIIMSMPTDFGSADLAQLKAIYDEVFEAIKVIAPAIMLSSMFLVSYFTIILSKYFAKGHPCFASIPSFSGIHARPIFLLVTIAAYFGQSSSNPFISGLMANLFLVMTTFFTICGFSLVDFLLKRKITSVVARFFIVIAVIFLLTVISMFMLVANPVLIAMLLGFADSFFNYRLRFLLSDK